MHRTHQGQVPHQEPTRAQTVTAEPIQIEENTAYFSGTANKARLQWRADMEPEFRPTLAKT